jgi:hypothetical protein
LLSVGLIMAGASAGPVSAANPLKPKPPSSSSRVLAKPLSAAARAAASIPVVSSSLPLSHHGVAPVGVASMADVAAKVSAQPPSVSPNSVKPMLPELVYNPAPKLGAATSPALSPKLVTPQNLPSAPTFATRALAGSPISAGGFAGLAWSNCTRVATCYEPPNSEVAVNATDLVQVVHQALRISSRAGTTLADIPFTSFFAWPMGALFDPHVLWDQAKGRWLVATDGDYCGTGYIHLAVSASADPLGAWKLYNFSFPGVLEDYDGLGFSSDKVVISADQYPTVAGNCGGISGYNGASLLIIDWSQLLSGSSLTYTQTAPNPSLFSWHPAASLSDTSTLSAAVEVQGADNWDLSYATISGTNAGANVSVSSALDLTTAGIASELLALDVSPFGIVGASVAEDGRLKNAVWQNGKLWLVTTSSCTPPGDSTVRDCVRVTELDTTTTTPILVQDFLMGQVGYDFFMGGLSLTVNGTLTVVFSASSASAHIDTYAAVQGPNAPINTYSPLTLVKAGQAIYTGMGYGRWGDYVGVAQDPSNPNAVWAGDEYPNASGEWSTWVSQLISDITPPVGSFSINAGATSSADPLVTIADQASDSGFGLGAMGVSNDGTHWKQLAYISGLVWDLTNPTYGGASGLGAKTVYLRWQDKAGNWSNAISHSINLTAGATYVSVAPTRIVDSRKSQGLTKLHAGIAQGFTVAGLTGVPANAVSVTGNLTVTGQTAGGYFALTPASTNKPGTSTLNFPKSDDRANGVTVPLGADGKIYAVYVAGRGNTAGLVFDLTGYFSPDDSGATYHGLVPTRILDSRSGLGSSLPFLAAGPREFIVAGAGGVPGNASAVTGNLTVTGQTAAGYVALTTSAQSAPSTSTLNFPKSGDRGNNVTVPLSSDGGLWATYVAPVGTSANLVFDVTGYFTPDASGASYVSLSPTRIVDSRLGLGVNVLHSKVAQTFTVAGVNLIPASASAVSGNLTVTGQTRSGYLALTTVASNAPGTSSLNFPVGDIRANGVDVRLGPAGTLSVTYVGSPGSSAQVIFDVTGYFAP